MVIPANLKRLPSKQCLPKMISYLSKKYDGSKTHDQIVAIAASECGISKKDYYGLDTGTRAALQLSRYKSKYPGQSLKFNLSKAYHKIIMKNSMVDFIWNNGQEGTIDEVLFQIKEDFMNNQPKLTLKDRIKIKIKDFTKDLPQTISGNTPKFSKGSKIAKAKGARTTKEAQEIKKHGVPLTATGTPSVTRNFTMVNTESGAVVEGAVTQGLPNDVDQMQPVSSSNVKAVGRAKNELVIAFQDNNESKFYRFQFATPEMASEARESLINSSSPGRWVWHNLRGHVKGEPVTPSKVGPSLERGIPTIGGTSASLVNYSISRTAPSRTPGYKEATEKLKRNTSNPSDDPSTGSRIEGLLGARKGFRELGRKIRQDITCDFTLSGNLTRSGEFDYTAEGQGIKIKTPENLKWAAENTTHAPVFGKRERGSHKESDYSLIGFAHNFKYIPPGEVDEYAHIAGDVETFYSIKDLSDLDDPSDLPVSFGFDDMGIGKIQKITKIHHLAVSLNKVEVDRCSTMNGPSCTISPKIKDFTIKRVDDMVKEKIETKTKIDDQNFTEDSQKLLQADLQTKLGDGDLLEEDGKYYYHTTDKILYEIDFDDSETEETKETEEESEEEPVEEDLTKTDEVRDTDELQDLGTDSKIEGTCPLKKNEEKKMKKTKQEDLYKDKEVEKKEEEEEEETTDIVKEDITPEAPEAPKLDMDVIKDLITNLVKDGLDEITKDFKADQKLVEDRKTSELNDLLQKEPYGYAKEYLEGRSLSKLNDLKDIVENSQVYRDFQKTKEPEISEDINKEIFDIVEGPSNTANDPWKKYKQDFGGDGK